MWWRKVRRVGFIIGGRVSDDFNAAGAGVEPLRVQRGVATASFARRCRPCHHVAPRPADRLVSRPRRAFRDGTIGSWVVAATVALPAEGGRVEAFISGRDIQLNAADLADVDLPAVCFAKAEVSPETPEGMHVGLTATLPA